MIVIFSIFEIKNLIMESTEIEVFCPTSQQEWRQWLEENHRSKQSVWLVYYKKKAQMPTISWSEAVDEALCFGWIDSTAKPVDEQTYRQFFTKRKPKSVWSKINKDKIVELSKNGLIAEAGYKVIEIAKQNGSWETLDDVEALIIPEDLELALQTESGLKEIFLNLSRSVIKSHLYRLALAKLPETRQKRISETIEILSQKRNSLG
jgi:uncharacterized protein YdeI (YjbR/CyaY-like superfamily)